MTDLFRVPDNQKPPVNNYEYLGFKYNPFPLDPSVKPFSKDERENGNIFLEELRRDEISKFIDIIINGNIKISFLMDYATYRGRGIGKTAFLNYIKRRINLDLGYNVSDGKSVIFAVYICPGGDKGERKFWQISKMIFDSIENEDLLLLIFSRLRYLVNEIDESVRKLITNDNLLETIANDEWLRQQKVNVHSLNEKIKKKLQDCGLDFRLSGGMFDDSSYSSFKRWICDNNTDLYWRKNGTDIVFNKLVKLFKAAQFTNIIFLFDESEKVIIAQNFSERREFCDNIRHFFIDGDNENAKNSFYKILMTIHPNSQELLLPHWNASGLDRFASLDGPKAENYTVFFNPLKNIENSILLAKEYLKRARINENDNSIEPFSEDAIHDAFKKSEGIPGKFLQVLFLSLEKAVTEKIGHINKDFINRVWKQDITSKKEVQPELSTVLPETKTKLDS